MAPNYVFKIYVDPILASHGVSGFNDLIKLLPSFAEQPWSLRTPGSPGGSRTTGPVVITCGLSHSVLVDRLLIQDRHCLGVQNSA